MLYHVKKLYSPEFYQGPSGPSRYFEGWYFKVALGESTFAVIPGVSRAAEDPHAFIQLVGPTAGGSRYFRFPLDSFHYGRDTFWVEVAGNRFSLDGLSVDLDGFVAELGFHGLHLWRGTLLQPGTMGWYSFVPFMECRHAIIVMDGSADGTVNGSSVSGRIYVEKDYGRSFPNAWIWLQSNSFAESGVSVTASIANVPFAGGAFTGFLAGFAFAGRLEKFTTYLGCRVDSIEVAERSTRVVLADAERRLAMTATRETGSPLAAPRDGAMRARVIETLASVVDVELSRGGRVLYRGRGESAGLEVVNPDRLLSPPPR